MRIVLMAVVIPVLVFLIFIGVRLGRGYYTAGLDALAGIAGIDLGIFGAAEEFGDLLSGPFYGLEALVFVALGLLGIVLFTFLSPVERALVDYSAHQLGAPNVGGQRGFPYVRLFLSWVFVSGLAALNMLLLVPRFIQ